LSDPNNPQDWIIKAEEDYEVARLLMRRNRLLTYAATFHAQQCAEKYLKAILVKYAITPPKIHDLVTLRNLCLRGGVLVPINEDDLSLLTKYAAQPAIPVMTRGSEICLGGGQSRPQVCQIAPVNPQFWHGCGESAVQSA
jgi:hypothetical protein